MASWLRIGESSKSSKLMSLAIAKGDYIIKAFKMESKTCLSPLDANVVSMYGGSYQRGNTQLWREQSTRVC